MSCATVLNVRVSSIVNQESRALHFIAVKATHTQIPAETRDDNGTSREKLILSAERLFAERGFDGASVRDIANDAGVNSALVGYYFRGKEGLLAEVYTRHCQPLRRERERLLEQFRSKTGKLRLEQVVEAFVRPSLEMTTDQTKNPGLTRLRAILSAENSSLLEQLVADNFDHSSLMFIQELSRCLPQLTREEVFWRFHFLLGTIYYTASGPHRVKKLSNGKCDPGNAGATWKQLLPYLVAGFQAPSTVKQEPGTKKARRRGDKRG